MRRNRELLRDALELPGEPVWLQQVHGTAVVDAAARRRPRSPPMPPGPRRPAIVCAVLTADCLPVLFCNRAGTHVAAAHAGWRGLAAGVLESTVAWLAADGVRPDSLLAWLGPAIGPASYEVGAEVRDAFLRSRSGRRQRASGRTARATGSWISTRAARQRLASRRRDGHLRRRTSARSPSRERFFSHRRDGVTGRQATLIWLG